MVSRYCHANKPAPFVTGQPVLKEIIIVDAIEQHGEHGCTYSKATDAEYAVHPVLSDVPECCPEIVREHILLFQIIGKGSFLFREFLNDAAVKQVDNAVGV